MTSILSSLFAYSSSGVSSAAQTSGSQSQSTQQTQGGSNNLFGEAFSLSISDAGLGALSGDNSQCSNSTNDSLSALTYSGSSGTQGGSSNFEALLINLTGSSDSTGVSSGENSNSGSSGVGGLDQLFQFLNQMMADAENSLENIGSGTTTTQASGTTASQTAANTLPSSSDMMSGDSFLSGGGPLPAFLQQVDASMHLDAAHQQALANIAVENQNVNYSPDTVQTIAGELQQAGI